MIDEPPDDLGGLWGARIRWPNDVGHLLGIHQVDVTCRCGAQVDVLTAVRGEGGNWSVKVADASHVLHGDREIDFTPQIWDLAKGAGDGKLRRRLRFICPSCGIETPARGEHLDAVVSQLAENGVHSITLDQLRRVL